MVPDAFTGDRVVAVALGFGTERADHLRVAAHAAFADVDIAAFKFQRGARLHAFHGFVGDVLEKQRDDLGQATDAHGDDHEEGQQAYVLLDGFMLHQCAPTTTILAASSACAGLAARTVRNTL
ncbi:hypothetical protein D3C75_1018530 [compost metagenome]